MTSNLNDLMNYAIENPDHFDISWLHIPKNEPTEEEILIHRTADEQDVDHEALGYMNALSYLLGEAMWLYTPDHADQQAIICHMLTAQKELTLRMVKEVGIEDM